LPSSITKLTFYLSVDNWNAFGCNVDESLVLDTASSIKNFGLQDVGYHYVVIDDCWSDGRDGNNMLQADGVKFPNGMTHVGDQLHDQGFGFGIYSDAGSNTVRAYDKHFDLATRNP
jgi:alpha-galactosidase